MQLNEERLEGIRVILMGNDSDGYTFFESAKGEDAENWYVSGTGLGKFGPEPEKGERDYGKIRPETFLTQIKGKELTAQIFLGYENGEEKNREYTEWEDFARAVGISEMVALSVKVPKNVAKRFKVFANEESTPADKMRELVVGYVADYMKKNAETLAFKESV